MTQRPTPSADEDLPPIQRPTLSPGEVVEFLAKYHGVAVKLSTLKKWRARGSGPDFFVIGRQVRYAPSDIVRWVKAGRRSSQAAQ